MKTSLLPLALCVLAASACDPLGDAVPFGRTRTDIGRHAPSAPVPGDADAALKDTTVLLAALEFPKSYDWQRDTSFGAVDFNLLLYRNYELVLSVSSRQSDCIGPDFDMYHIIDGHVYSVVCHSSRTLVGRDGSTLFSIPDGEIVKGILPLGEDVYTLSAHRSGRGFSLRRNGKTLMERSEGLPFGSLQEPSYGATGALSLNDGAICFGYSSGARGSYKYYVVRDGEESQVKSSLVSDERLSDLKVFRNSYVDSPPQNSRYRLEDGRVWFQTRGYCHSGELKPKDGSAPFWGVLYSDSEPEVVADSEVEIYCTDAGARGVFVSEEGYVTVCGADAARERLLPRSRFLSPSCATLLGRRFLIALSPRDITSPPVVIDSGVRHELDIHGFVCCVRLEAED